MAFIIPQAMDGWDIEVLKNILEIPDVEKVLISKITRFWRKTIALRIIFALLPTPMADT